MFERFKKKTVFFTPVDGMFVPLTDVPDPVFSQKMMGEGFGVQPMSTEIYSPIKGVVTTIFQTKHAIGLTNKNGVEVLLHIGIDTVELAGRPFEIFVQEGQKVDEKTLIGKVDFKQIRAAGKEDVVLTLITSGGATFDALVKKQVTHGEVLN